MIVSLQNFDISSLRLVGARSLSRYDSFKLLDHLQHDLDIITLSHNHFCCEGSTLLLLGTQNSNWDIATFPVGQYL